jgi:hypothetical protein
LWRSIRANSLPIPTQTHSLTDAAARQQTDPSKAAAAANAVQPPSVALRDLKALDSSENDELLRIRHSVSEMADYVWLQPSAVFVIASLAVKFPCL